jgi:hypothetical protein
MSGTEGIERVIRPKELFDTLQVKDVEESEKAFKYAFDFLNYMSVGDVIETTQGSYEKISEDLIHITPQINTEDMVNTLAKKRIIKFLF